MPIIVTCSCGTAFRVPESAAGKRVKCSKCGGITVVPQPQRQEEPAAPDDAERPSPQPGLGSEPRSASSGAVKRTPLTPAPGSGEPGPAQPDRPVFDDRAKQLARERYKDVLAEKPSTNLLEYAYWVLLLAFIPLAFSLLPDRKDDTEDRLVRSLEKSFPAPEKAAPKQKRPAQEPREAPVIAEEPNLPEVSVDDLLARLPGGRIEGALLPRKTYMHWLYALLAGGGFLALALLLFPGTGRAVSFVGIAAFTATIGILLLLLAQLLAGWTQGHILISRNIIVMLLYWIAWAIGFSYRAAIDPEVGLVPSFLGYTFGVGFCEEVCKALPLLWHYRVHGALPWRTACAWGFVSGVGFGTAEGIMYAADFYNGIATGDVYLVRFISCVALHAIWAASAALFIHRHQAILQADFVWYEFIPRALFLVGIPMILHGLYDTLLKKEMNVPALLTALVSFAWFAWSVERTRRGEESPQIAAGHT